MLRCAQHDTASNLAAIFDARYRMRPFRNPDLVGLRSKTSLKNRLENWDTLCGVVEAPAPGQLPLTWEIKGGATGLFM